MARSLVFAAPLMLALAACSGSEDGTSITINTDNGSGAALDGETGEVKIDTPVFQGSFKLPKMQLTADNFDIDGVKLYPGTKIGALNVAANGKGGKDGVVTLKFESPASATTVRDWLKGEFEKAGNAVTIDGNGLRGTTDGDPFRIDLVPNGERASGTVTIG